MLHVVPGVWLYTRWSLSTPVICKEDMGPVASLKRSSALVRGRFWFVLGTATLAFVSEEAVIHAGALATGYDHGIAYLGRVGRRLDRRGAGHAAGRPYDLGGIFGRCEARAATRRLLKERFRANFFECLKSRIVE